MRNRRGMKAPKFSYVRAQSVAPVDLQAAFVARNALPRGFCAPRVLLTTTKLLQRATAASRAEVRTLRSGNAAGAPDVGRSWIPAK